ncbi:lectin-domain containing receptor kinase [Hordeum vulgare]|nr:lectin-domain containing receptor kinase [Hordeum vulgare]
MDIDGEHLFEEELANQTVVGAKLKCKSKRAKAYTPAEDKLLYECWRDIGQDPKIAPNKSGQPYGLVFIVSSMSARSFPVPNEKQAWMCSKLWRHSRFSDGKAFHITHCWTIINGEEKFKAQYAALLAHGGKEAMQDHGDGN